MENDIELRITTYSHSSHENIILNSVRGVK